ncbi:MAG: hypothetical protein EON92_01410 [Burkholderiales bacterium]|nr:MAG: hypothetical protein EON92_01410 [Burkholderiales bacterium]
MARIPYPTRDALEEEAAVALDGMKPMNVFRMMARADSLAPPIFDAATRLFTKGGIALQPRWRQVAILRTAGAMGAAYLVSHHEPISRRVKMTDAEIAACVDPDEAGWAALGAAEAAIARLATESTLNVKVSDATFSAVRAVLNDREVVEVILVIGLYNLIGRMLVALDVEVEAPPGTTPSNA